MPLVCIYDNVHFRQLVLASLLRLLACEMLPLEARLPGLTVSAGVVKIETSAHGGLVMDACSHGILFHPSRFIASVRG